MVRHLEAFAVCDVCGTEGAGHHQPLLDGVTYDLDLCAQHEIALALAIDPFVSAARQLRA